MGQGNKDVYISYFPIDYFFEDPPEKGTKTIPRNIGTYQILEIHSEETIKLFNGTKNIRTNIYNVYNIINKI